ncbi:helix-turn-helix domain-containing protein [Comamonadaceae bacterium PP-2]
MTSSERANSPQTSHVDSATAPASGQAVSAGQMLREARERAGLHLASLAAVLKVPVQRLEALEADRYDQLPGMAFVRGLASSMSRTLKLDVNEVLARLPKSEAATLKQDHTVAAVSRSRSLPSHAGGYGGRSRLTRILGVLVVVLLLGAAAIVFLPQVRGLAATDDSTQPVPAEGGGAGVGTLDGAPAGDGSVAAPAAGDATASGGSLALTTLMPGPVSTPSTAPAAPVPNAAAAPAAGAAATTPAAPTVPAGQGVLGTPTTGTIVFSAVGESWVEVLDGNRLPLLRRTLQVGEKVGVSGAEPLSVTVGHSTNVKVEVRGQPFNINTYQRGNVARFQVK